MKDKEKLTIFSSLKYLKGFYKKLYFHFGLFYFGRLINMLEEIILPILVGLMMNQVVYYENFDLFLRVGFVLMGLSAFSCIVCYLTYEVYSDFWNEILRRIRQKMFHTVMHMDAETMSNSNYGDLAQQVQWKVTECVQLVVKNIIHNINNIVKIIICLFIVFRTSWVTGCVLLILLPVSGFVSWKCGQKIREEQKKNQDSYGEYVNWLYEIFGSYKDLRLLGAEKRVKNLFVSHQKKLIKTDVKASVITVLAQNIIQNVNVWVQMLLYVVLAVMSLREGLTVGALLVVLSYYTSLNGCIKTLCDDYFNIQKRLAVIQRLKKVLEAPVEEDKPSASVCCVEKGNISFREVDFAYRQKDRLLNGFSLEIEQGDKIAIVGESGCGKSTLAYLLLNFYEPQRGEILIDGMPISDFSRAFLRQQVGVVQQEVLIFDGTIKENIMISRPSATGVELEQACKAAGVYDFVMEMDDKFDTLLGKNGRNLSGGQKQRIAIARVYLKNPAILIFDEATASLDKETEAQIHANWKEALKGRTSIVIAHRQSAVMLCDKVALMQEGKIVEIGTPEYMKEHSSAFRALFAIEEKAYD